MDVSNGQKTGLVVVLIGIVFYWISVRTMQQRVMVGSFPVLLFGIVLYLWGWGAAKAVMIPLGLLYFVIPMPGLTQATNELQVMATQGSFHIVRLLGVDVVASGNYLNSPTDAWGFNVAEGCSGIRSLMAMGLVAAIFAHVAEKVWWKKIILFACALPLAVVANILRVASIILLAEFVNQEFAGNLYHDYSSFLFFPFALFGLIFVSQLLNFSKFFGHQVTSVTRRVQH